MLKIAKLSLALFLAFSGVAAATTPNDPFFPQQWALHNDGTQEVSIDLDDLHTLAQKGVAGIDIGWLDALSSLTALARTPVTVAVIDSGIDPKHPDLQGRIQSDGWDFLAKSATLTDDIGHGTHVSGIIAANAGNGLGIAGVAPAPVHVLPLRILSTDFTSFAYNNELISDYAADAIRYAVAHGASVINMSLGWPKVVNTDNVRQAVAQAVQKGVLIVAAAGNDRKDEPTYPCALEGVLCVGSISNNGSMAFYSNSGGAVDLIAPGDGIVSSFPSALESAILRIQGYEMLSGTSQAAPHVAGMAAAIKSAYPSISLNELKARLLSSAATQPPGASLYGLSHLKRALEAQPQPVFLPDFKAIDEVAVDEATLRIHGSLAVQNLWAQASHVHARVRINGQDAGKAQIAQLGQGERLNVPWQYAFASLDDPSDVNLSLEISASGVAPKTFAYHFSAARSMLSLRSASPLALPNPEEWLSSTNGHLFSRVSAVTSFPAETGAPRYYEPVAGDASGITVHVFEPGQSETLATVKVPALQRITQVLRMDIDGSGKMSWVITGLGVDAQKKVFFQFYFLDPDLRPLWGSDAASIWKITLDGLPQGQAIVRNYGAPNSWLKGTDGKLLPCFIGQGQLPDPDNFNRLDPRRYVPDTHLFYLQPQPQTANSPSVTLVLRALDNTGFHQKYPNTHLRAAIPSVDTGADAGHLRVLLTTGTDLSASISLWDVRSVGDNSVGPASGWDALSGSAQPTLALTTDYAMPAPVLSSFFDSTRGTLVWTGTQGQFAGSSEFSYNVGQDPIAGLTAAFSLPGVGRFWFLETRFNLVAFRQDDSLQTPPEMRSLPIERDSTFPGQQFSEMLTPVVVGTTAQPLPGIYIDSTLVRGNRVSIAVWNPKTSSLEKPLRYSLQIPDGCVQMSPLRTGADVQSFALPLICQKAGGALELRSIQP